MLFRRYTKFEKDARVALVDSLDQIPRCGRIFSRVNGVLCPYDPFTRDEEREILGFMQRLGKYGVSDVYAQISSAYYKYHFGMPMPAPLTRTFAELKGVFLRSAGFNGNACMRANSKRPEKPHQHPTTLSFTFSGTGTIGYTMDGKSYTIPEKHLFIFDQEIPHAASQEFPQDRPKLTILVG